jgi:SAM-dependent methyltransferase
MNLQLDSEYWNDRYLNHDFEWDIGYVSTPLKNYIDVLTDKDLKILIPGAGNSYEAEYLFNKGFKNVYLCDYAEEPLKNFLERVPGFPKEQLLQVDFFELEGHKFDLILEQTFFCAITPMLRAQYFEKMSELLNPKGILAGVLFNEKLNTDKPPYGGNQLLYYSYFKKVFQIKVFEKCYHSVPARAGRELFMILQKH